MKHTDITGNRYGRLTVIEYVGKDKSRNSLWKCKCDCGNYIIEKFVELNRNHTSSCGCYQKERAKEANLRHGKSHIKLNMVWSDMKARCSNPKHHAYHWYGEKGISVCEDWQDYTDFENWALSNGYKEGLTIDRIDGNGNYCPENCRWATRKEQSNNLSTCVFFEFMGERLNITQFCEKYNVSISTFRKYVRKNINYDTLMLAICKRKSRITDEEWERLCDGYKRITGENYKI